VLRFVFDLDIPLLNGRVPFQRTAYELVRRCSGAEIPEGILKDQVGLCVCGGGCSSAEIPEGILKDQVGRSVGCGVCVVEGVGYSVIQHGRQQPKQAYPEAEVMRGG
jgi:hypothetical protein